MYFLGRKNGIRDGNDKKCGMRDSSEKGAGMRDQDLRFQTPASRPSSNAQKQDNIDTISNSQNRTRNLSFKALVKI